MITQFFKVQERESKISTEFFAGLTTFLTMGYIIFLQPAILSGLISGNPTGMDAGALITTTCIASAFACFAMGLLANFPIALAPGMGENFFFVSVVAVCVTLPGITPELAWQTALGIVFISGVLFLIITIIGARKWLMKTLSPSIQHAIAGGIGLFIAYIGLKNGGILEATPAGIFITHNLKTEAVLIFFIGLSATCAMKLLRIKGYIIWGILLSAILACALGKIKFSFPVSLPASPMPVIGKINLSNVFSNLTVLLPFIIIFLFMDIFDTLGTLIGVASQANLMKNDTLPGCEKAFFADALSTVFGAICGHSTVTSYIESASGVEYGGRTGLTAIFAGLFFLLAIFLSPLVQMIANYPGGVNPITAPALVIVGAMMLKNITAINWDDAGEAIPAFLTLIGIPFTSSISDGLILGITVYPIINLLGGNWKKIHWTNYFLSILLILYLIFVKSH